MGVNNDGIHNGDKKIDLSEWACGKKTCNGILSAFVCPYLQCTCVQDSSVSVMSSVSWNATVRF